MANSISSISILEYDGTQERKQIVFAINGEKYTLDWGENPEGKLLFYHRLSKKVLLVQGPEKIESAIVELLHDLPNKLGEPKNINELFVAARFWNWAELMYC